MVSMKDVSRLAGVSVATVSNVITGKKAVSEQVRRRVLDAIEELDYQVNLVARGLKTRRTSHHWADFAGHNQVVFPEGDFGNPQRGLPERLPAQHSQQRLRL